LARLSRRFEAQGANGGVEVIGDALIEAIELRSLLLVDCSIRADAFQQAAAAAFAAVRISGMRIRSRRQRSHVAPAVLRSLVAKARLSSNTLCCTTERAVQYGGVDRPDRRAFRGHNLALVLNPCALRRRPTAGAVPGHQGGGVDAVLRPLPTKMRSADLGVPQNRQRGRELRARRPLLGRLQSQKKGLGRDRGRPEEEKYGIATIAHDR
jgi:hypothetical protein